MRERMTTPNPDGKTYRVGCAVDTEKIHNIPGPGGYPTLFGSMIDDIGKMEDAMPLSEWAKVAKKIASLPQKEMLTADGCLRLLTN